MRGVLDSFRRQFCKPSFRVRSHFRVAAAANFLWLTCLA
jgi:hypothetical protein